MHALSRLYFYHWFNFPVVDGFSLLLTILNLKGSVEKGDKVKIEFLILKHSYTYLVFARKVSSGKASWDFNWLAII